MVSNSARHLERLSPIRAIGAAMLIAACAAGPGVPASATLPSGVLTPTAIEPTPTPVPSPTPLATEAATVFTTDDAAIATIIKESAADAIPKLGTVARLSLEDQTAFFIPVPAWITKQLDRLAKLVPSGCTKDAFVIFKDGMGRFRNLAQDFLDWREWGAAGLPYTLSVPKHVAKLLGDAVTALEAHCPLPA